MTWEVRGGTVFFWVNIRFGFESTEEHTFCSYLLWIPRFILVCIQFTVRRGICDDQGDERMIRSSRIAGMDSRTEIYWCGRCSQVSAC